ncbi:hypothetical protein CMI37_33695 [Candidatus Pacearchaeota archaeon]|nr:hypothetical protein [Candidatus Pacearchaeota archaeon]|tara:strand:- start:860 stop:1519 length:660 start_codon:yes stop_codon:yes gene_type:complete
MDNLPFLAAHTRNNSGLLSYNSNTEKWEEKYIALPARTKNWDLVVDEIENHQIYTYPLFTKSFCEDFIKITEEYGKWKKSRHKHYPTTDMLLADFEMNEIYENALNKYVYPAMRHLYSLDGERWDSLESENFVAKYGEKIQNSLGIHHEVSLITALVNLSQVGEDFEGGGTFFKKQKVCVQPPRGNVSLHPGDITHKHGGRPTTKGTRYIIVSFSSFKK